MNLNLVFVYMTEITFVLLLIDALMNEVNEDIWGNFEVSLASHWTNLQSVQ